MRVFDKSKYVENMNINIRDTFKDGDSVKYRNSDNSRVDSIDRGIKIRSEYYKDNKLIGTVGNFDSRIIYTFIKNKAEDGDITCSNCSYHASSKEFIDGCPYCGTIYNIDYDDKNLGNKYTYDYKYKSRKFIFVTLIVDLIICLILSLIYILFTGRTFNSYDIAKVIVGGILLGLILFYPLYILDGYIVLAPIKRLKRKQNEKQRLFWESNSDVDKKTFMNNFNYEITKLVYSMENVIDYNIEDYNEFEVIHNGNEKIIKVNATIRLIKYKDNEIQIETINQDYKFKRVKKTGELQGGINVIMCPNCSSSIDVTEKNCKYCGMEINYLQEWYLVN